MGDGVVEIARMQIEFYDASMLLRRVMEALDHEVEVGGRVPFDPDVIREFLGSVE